MAWEYNAVLTGEQFLYYEIRIVSKLILEGFTRDEIKEKIIEENLFQYPTERRIATIVGVCFKRIDAIDSAAAIELLANASTEIGKQVNMYAMMKTYRIVWDFMITVIGEKFRTQDFDFGDKDFNVFFMQLQEQNDSIAGWKARTVSEIKGAIRRAMINCDYIESANAKKLNTISIVPELEDIIKENNDTIALSAFNCFRL